MTQNDVHSAPASSKSATKIVLLFLENNTSFFLVLGKFLTDIKKMICLSFVVFSFVHTYASSLC